MKLLGFVFSILMFPVLAIAEEPAALRAWMEENPIRAAFPAKGDIPAMNYEQQEKWIACLNSGLFPSELAYLADLLVATGKAGDAERHRALTGTMAKVVSLNSSSKATHERLSGYYPMVRTWLLIRTDPSKQKGPGGWAGVMQELTGLGLPPEAIALVMREVLDKLDDANYNSGLTAIQKFRFYLELAEIEHEELQSQLFIHRWQLPPWSPAELGDPAKVKDGLAAMLKDRKDRVAWATFLLSWSWGNPRGPNGLADYAAGKTQRAKWAQGFKRATAGTWLEGLAVAYADRSAEPRQVVVYALFEPAARAGFHHLPLGLQQQIATDYALSEWIAHYPEQAEAVLTCCMATIAKSIRAVAGAPSKFDYGRHAVTGEVGRSITRRYRKHPDSSRALVNTLQSALDAVFAQDLGPAEPDIRSSLQHVFKLLEQFAFLEERLQAAEKR